MLRWLAGMGCFLLCWVGYGEEPSAAAWRSALSEVTDQPQFKHAHWGVLFVDQESGDVIYEYQAEKLFAPASCTKLFSVAAALESLGSDYRFKTRLVRHGTLQENGDLAGDLILVASGDLNFGGRANAAGGIEFTTSDHTYAGDGSDAVLTSADPLAGLDDLAAQVAKSGIKRVRGDVQIDDRLFEKAAGSGSGPGTLTPIMVNDNAIDFTIEATQAGELARVTWRPQSAALRVELKVETVSADQSLSVRIHDLGHGRLLVQGQVPQSHKPVVRIHEVDDPTAWARTLLIEALQRNGVRIDAPLTGDIKALPSREEVAAAPEVAVHTSVPLAESAKLILKVSHNLHASTLPLLVAAKASDRTLSRGLRLQHDLLKRLGVDADSISFGGGAGGARADYVTPRATVQLLRHMAQRSDFSVYHEALPSLGIDGTLAKVVSADSPARGKVFAKTGTLYWDNVMNGRTLLTSKALAGYMTNSQGRSLAFAVYVNNVHLGGTIDASSIGRDLGRICELAFEQP